MNILVLFLSHFELPHVPFLSERKCSHIVVVLCIDGILGHNPVEAELYCPLRRVSRQVAQLGALHLGGFLLPAGGQSYFSWDFTEKWNNLTNWCLAWHTCHCPQKVPKLPGLSLPWSSQSNLVGSSVKSECGRFQHDQRKVRNFQITKSLRISWFLSRKPTHAVNPLVSWSKRDSLD